MSRKYLRSDMSKQELKFFTCGGGVCGEENAITGLLKIVGKFTELKELNRGEEIADYLPEKDQKFMYENRGITELSAVLRSKYGDRKYARKGIKNLSRKWALTPVVMSYSSERIIIELLTYTEYDKDLCLAAKNYLSRVGKEWSELIPIQYDFLCVRHMDQHKNYLVAGKIINELANIQLR